MTLHPLTFDELVSEDGLANALYVAVVNPDLIWWDDLTPEMQEGWRRGARRVLDTFAVTGVWPPKTRDEGTRNG